MAEAARLYTAPLSMFGAKAEIALREKGLPFERISVSYDPVAGYSPKHPEVVRVNPKGQVPVLIEGDLEIFDSTQIFEYLEDRRPDPPLWPRDAKERARARLLELQSDEVYFPHIIRLMGLQDALFSEEAKTAIRGAALYCERMERLLGDRPYFTGDPSYADIGFFMAQLFGERMSAPLTERTPKLLEWRARMAARPAVRESLAPLVAFLQERGRPVPAFLA